MFSILFFLICLKVIAQSNNEILFNGNEAYKKGDYKTALKNYEKVLKKDSLNNNAQFNSGVALQRQKKYPEAAKAFQSAARNSNDTLTQSKSFYNKGVAEVNQKQIQEAVNSFKQSLRINPNDDDTRENLQKALNELNKKNNEQKQDKKQQQKPQDKKEQNKLNKQQAENLLNQLREQEKRLQEQQKQKIKQVKPDKDW